MSEHYWDSNYYTCRRCGIRRRTRGGGNSEKLCNDCQGDPMFKKKKPVKKREAS